MNSDVVINLVMDAMTLAFKVAMPLLGVALVLGLAVSVVQAVTQIQEQTLSFIPKIVGMGVVLVVAGPWMLNQVIAYTTELYTSIPSIVGGG
jgi:flagellar biosynthesis protein FliQ